MSSVNLRTRSPRKQVPSIQRTNEDRMTSFSPNHPNRGNVTMDDGGSCSDETNTADLLPLHLQSPSASVASDHMGGSRLSKRTKGGVIGASSNNCQQKLQYLEIPSPSKRWRMTDSFFRRFKTTPSRINPSNTTRDMHTSSSPTTSSRFPKNRKHPKHHKFAVCSVSLFCVGISAYMYIMMDLLYANISHEVNHFDGRQPSTKSLQFKRIVVLSPNNLYQVADFREKRELPEMHKVALMMEQTEDFIEAATASLPENSSPEQISDTEKPDSADNNSEDMNGDIEDKDIAAQNVDASDGEAQSNQAIDDGKCQPLEDWQSKSFPTCNSFHEIDLTDELVGQHHHRKRKSNSHSRHDSKSEVDQRLAFLGEGWFRSTWRFNATLGDVNRIDSDDDSNVVVLKVLRYEREFMPEYFELHRRDAVAMERLTSSSFVMNVYGYCGQSALNEWANFRPDILSLEQLTRKLRGKPGTLKLRLRLATSVAVGLAHIHAAGNIIDEQSTDAQGSASSSDPRSTLARMAHYDLNPRNIAIMKGGKPKLNDFNTAEFLQYNAKTNTTCGFRSRFHEPWWRAPEEMNMSSTTFVDEKVDVYALGNVLYHIWTTHSPRGKMKKERMEQVRDQVRQGVPPSPQPSMPDPKNPANDAFRLAMELCFRPDPKDRGSAREVANILYSVLMDISNNE